MVKIKLSIDVGYSCVKAISENGRKVIMPSIIAPFRELPLYELSKNGTGYVVEIRNVNGTTSKYFVGDLAIREGRSAATFTMDRKKHLHQNHDILLLTTARLLGATNSNKIVVGLPVAYFREQKDELEQHIERLHGEVSVNGNNFERISFDEVKTYPQAAGALLTVDNLPSKGTVLVLDVGQKTTDFVGADVSRGIARPVSSLCDSIEIGVHDIFDAIAAEFRTITGAPIDLALVADIFRNGSVCFRGKDLDFTEFIKKARKQTAQSIADRVLSSLGDRADFIKQIYIAGGGTMAIPELLELLPASEVIPDPRWANAKGFLKV